ncbi:MAG: RagB/SusD family nutrient uptake outer membrane protein [Mediterranea sp.]|jgi:tetratricopeptide (TPR) repeat protein|nr:RagB/SusD family nutrient uptake outer membrane protein [Mediterranea sp.]
MKKIALYGLFLYGLSLFAGCNSDFLEKEPPLYVTEQDVFTDASRLDANVNSLYAGLKSQYSLGGKCFGIIDNIGEDFINISGNGYELMYTYQAVVGIGIQENYEFWRYTYLALNRVNTFLKNIEIYKEYVGNNYDKYIAEAKFVRALGYYYLHQLYTMPYVINPNAKSVPLRLQAEADIFNNDLARASSQEVLEQILLDLSASGALPVRNSNAEEFVTRATQGAAEALRMRIYILRGEWDKAIESGNKITGYSLVDNITSLFKAPYITSENIFSMPFDATNRPSSQYANGYFYINGKSDVIDTKDGIVSIDGYDNMNDVRINTFTTIPNGGRVFTKYTSSTYLDWMPVFRYAEVLLNLAEAHYNKGEYDKAISYLKQVRQRSLSDEDDTLNIDALTGDALKTAIYNERRLEFMGEGMRGFDILRRGETIVKQRGEPDELIVTPSQGINGYIWPIPQTERAQNHLIED